MIAPNLYLWLHLIAACFCAICALYVRRYKDIPAVRPFTFMMTLSVIWALIYGLSISTVDIELRTQLSNWMYLATRLIPPASLFLALEYTGHDRWINRRLITLVLVIPVIAIIASITSPFHTLFRYHFILDTSQTIPVLRYSGGVIYWISSWFGDTLMLITIITMLRSLRDKALSIRNTLILLTGILVPVAVNILFTNGITPVTGFNFASISLTITGNTFIWALLRFQLFGVAPIARATVMDHVEDIIIVFDTRRQLVDFNQTAARECGLNRKHHLGKRSDELEGDWGAFLTDCVANPPCRRERTLTIDGERKVWDLSVSAIEDSHHRVLGRMILLHDISLLKELLSEKDLLLREVHHRIKNNMSVISSILSLQADALGTGPAREALCNAKSRVQSMMILYEKLYRNTYQGQIPLSDYLCPLIDRIMENFEHYRRINISKDIVDTLVDSKILFSLGIVLNELLTNTMKHAFPPTSEHIRSGCALINIEAAIESDFLAIDISDNGICFPASVDIHNSTGFGLQLVNAMIQQLSGTVELERGDGTRFRIRIPLGA